VLDDEAEVFVVKMWRLLIYETEAKKLGLVKWRPAGVKNKNSVVLLCQIDLVAFCPVFTWSKITTALANSDFLYSPEYIYFAYLIAEFELK